MNPKYIETIHSLLYKLISEHYRNKVDLELKLGSDLIDQIWQIPYERLNEKNRKRFDDLVESVVDRIGTDNPFQILVLDAGLSEAELNELVSTWKLIEQYKKQAPEGEEKLEDVGIVSDEVLNESIEQEHLLQSCYLAFMELESRGMQMPSIVRPTIDRLNKRYRNESTGD